MNNLIKLQEMIMNEMETISNLDLEKGLTKREIERSKALSCSATNYIKAVNTNLKIKEYADKNKVNSEKILDELGLLNGENK